MKLTFVSYHAPLAEGSAAGRQLFAVGTALEGLGHTVECLAWQPNPPGDLPPWARWMPLRERAGWRVRGRALARPRSEVATLGLHLSHDAIAIADEPFSYAALAKHPQRATGVFYCVDLDRKAQRDRSAARLQDARAERRAVRGAHSVWTLSERVRAAVGRGTVVPATLPLPRSAVEFVEQPVVGLLGDWSWAPNRLAADALLKAWPSIRDRVPGATLLLAGRGSSPVGTLAGVSWLGELAYASDLLSQLAVFAFPCPDTSGPKIKTLDALAHGVPVVTTPAGAEGVHTSAGLRTDDLVNGVVALLSDPQGRAAAAGQARQAMERYHSPEVAALARVEVLRATAAP